MPRTVRNANLETRTARARLKPECFHWQGITQGLAIGYRRARLGFGSWTVRALEREAGKYTTHRIGRADDLEAADGREVLTYHQAADRARALAQDGRGGTVQASGPYTVEDAARDYLEWFAQHRKSLTATKTVLDAHVLPKFRRRIVAELEKRELERWHQGIAAAAARARGARGASSPVYREQDLADPDVARKRRATANRILSVFRAVLNHAWRDGRVPSDSAWRRVRPFRNASEPLVRYFTEEEARRLVNGAQGEFRPLARAGLLTGCRYGELGALRVEDYRAPFSKADTGAVYVRESKSGKPRSVPLTPEGVEFFDELTAGRAAGELMFSHDGGAWKKGHQVRPMAEACARAKISPAASFHVLRHTVGAWLTMRGVSLQVVATMLGHSDTRITHRHYGHLAPSYVAQMIRDNLPRLAPAGGKVKPMRRAAA